MPTKTSQTPVPVVLMRGGTSRAVFFHRDALPDEPVNRDETILAVMGSPHPRQIDGLGGADSLTSKIAIVEPAPSTAEADVSYTFGQVHIDRPHVDYTATCGNISSAVGHFAIEEGLLEGEAPKTRVTIAEQNNGITLVNDVPVSNGVPRVDGDFSISGVNGTGARTTIGFLDTGGEMTGDTFPLGVRETWEIDGREIEGTVVDAAGNPSMFVSAASLGIRGTESPAELERESSILERVEELRIRVGLRTGIFPDRNRAIETHLPVPIAVAPPASYRDLHGERIDGESISLLTRRLSNLGVHKACAGTGAVCTALTSATPGTVVNDVVGEHFPDEDGREAIRIGHPSGWMAVACESGRSQNTAVFFGRTARRILNGTAYVR